ncbi:ABC transporter permease [Mycoplasma sp. Mirounga ES2805-ORL]|uniref:ABC transporter permease n=1 Tax=Mycoplasma sp. Mirounga ES2805-ORL TaxID=754514 RepID=UPI00197BDF41|nr:ABC transporter permease [Mycoplasma sp. Mirounga ES2805-ORL]QSF13503.1 ABC transporter permease [Mycoplasma sp. Mirounga ES2805-ORL]
MWRLFKEVFKSLSKNKVVVIGLSILVFITSAIFTLLAGVKKSINSKYNEYKNVSKLHDLSVDLNLPTSGDAYNQGYFLNGKTSSEANGPITFNVSQGELSPELYDYKNEKKNILYLNGFDNEFIKLSDLGIDNSLVSNYYIAKKELQNIYSIYEIEDKNGIGNDGITHKTFEFNLGNADNAYFEFKNPTTSNQLMVPLYDKSGKRVLKDLQLSKGDIFTFDKSYKVGDIANVKQFYVNNSNVIDSIIISQVSPFFINLNTKKITLDFNVGNNWMETGEGYKLTSTQVAELFGFEEKTKFVYKQKDINVKSTYIDYKTGEPTFFNENLLLKPTISFTEFANNLPDSFNNKEIQNFVFKKNTKYSLPKEWLAKYVKINNFLRWNYTTSFVGEYKNKWSGSYKVFMETLGDLNSNERSELWDKLDSFSYWRRRIETTITPYSTHSNAENYHHTVILKLSSDFDYSEIKKIKLNSAELNIIDQSIREIEQNTKNKNNKINYFSSTKYEDEEILKLLNNEEILTERYKIIKDNAFAITKEEIIHSIKDWVNGDDNIGLRQTLTIDSVDDKNNSQSTFHFINTGDSNFIIDGIQMNVGKLFNEQSDKSKLNSFLKEESNSQNGVFHSDQIPSYFAAKIIQSITRNLYPDPNYIKPVLKFANVKRPIGNKKYQVFNSSKIIFINKLKQSGDSNVPNYKELNLGLIFVNNKYYFVSQIKNKFGKMINEWQVVSINGSYEGMEQSFLESYMRANKLTIATEYLKQSGTGWVKIDPVYKNISYIPILFSSPKSDLVNNALENGNVDFLGDAIQNYLLKNNLIKKGYVSSSDVYYLNDAIKKVLRDNNFADVFVNGKMDNGLIPKIIFEILYELSHSNNGDVFKDIIIRALRQAKINILSKGSIDDQTNYLIGELNNLFILISNAFNVDFSKYISPESIVKCSNEPSKVIDGFIEIIKSVDIAKITSQAKQWFIDKSKKPYILPNGTRVKNPSKETYTVQLSSSTIIDWILNSINGKTFKLGLKQLILNINFEKALDLNDSNSLLFEFLSLVDASLIEPLKTIVKKMNAAPLNPYSNVREGLFNIIDDIDFSVIVSHIHSSKKIKNYMYKVANFNNNTNQTEEIQHKISVETISLKQGVITTIKGLLNTPGSNKALKSNLIKIFNLSDKTSNVIEGIYFPDDDPNKLGFFDFIGFFTTLLKNSDNKIFKNYSFELLILDSKKEIEMLPAGEIIISSLSKKVQENLIKLGVFDSKINKDKLLSKLSSLINLIEQTKGGIDLILANKKETGTALIAKLLNLEEGQTTWLVFKKLIAESAKVIIENEYALGAQAFDIYKPYFEMLANQNASPDEAIKFINDFLALSINPNILRYSQELSSNENLPFHSSTKFGINRFLAEPSTVDLFNRNSSNTFFINNEINDLVKNNPKFEKWILNNKNLLINQLGLIASSKSYNVTSEYPNGAYHYVISTFVSKYLSKQEVKDNRDIIVNLNNKMIVNLPTNLFGINNALINPVLRSFFPEITISYLANQKNTPGKINGNLAYLLMNKIINLEELVVEGSEKNNELNKILGSFPSSTEFDDKPLDLKNIQNLVIDASYFEELLKQDNPSFLEIDFAKMVPDLLKEIIEAKEMKEIVFTNASSYLAKVNFAYLNKNDKEIYAGEIPSNPSEILDFVNKLDDKFTININGSKFIIVGQETTVDYMYPVIDENHIQVNTQNQALVYVNESGFARMRQNYQGNVVKSALLIKNNSKYTNSELKEKIARKIDISITDSNKLQRVFLATEVDPINPERAIRVKTVQDIINTISLVSTILISVLIFLVSVSIIFIIQRYISNKRKVLGILVAQGYSPFKIALSFTAFALVTSVIGGILGYAIGNRLQFVTLDVFSSYWTLPKETIPFQVLPLIFTVFLPFIGMSLLIILVSLIILRIKPLHLMSGVDEVPSGYAFKKYYSVIKKRNIKTKFGLVLAWTSFWKLISFGVSVLLVSVATLFGISSNNIFSRTITKTYENRAYKFKIDLKTPTAEGGLYKTYSPEDVNNNLYVPIGNAKEGERQTWDYFRPGESSVINDGGANGNPQNWDSHILSQFSTDISVDTGVSINPWEIAYNSMPDTQKVKIDRLRDRLAYQLEKTQSNDNLKWIVDPVSKNLSLFDLSKNKNVSFFKYYKAPYSKSGSFKYAFWNGTEYEMHNITTANRLTYREFLVNGYAKVASKVKEEQHNPKLIKDNANNSSTNENKNNYWLKDHGELYGPSRNDYFISFGGILFDENHDQKYTYINALYNKTDIKIYGYQFSNVNNPNIYEKNRYINFEDDSGTDLSKLLFNYKVINNIYPVIINDVVAKKYSLSKGSIFSADVTNHVNRFKNQLLRHKNKYEYKFEVVGINSTYINEEFVTKQEYANLMTGLDKLQPSSGILPFNGVITKNSSPIQLTDSASLYAINGYWTGLEGIDLESLDKPAQKAIFENIFGKLEGNHLDKNFGVLPKQVGLTQDQIMRILDKESVVFDANKYKSCLDNPATYISEYMKVYNNKLFVIAADYVDSKDIESGFTQQIGHTVEIITVSVIVITFLISIVILIMISSMMINENQRNIAIWSILGYNQKEKIRMFFGVFIPFILLFVLMAIPLSMLLIFGFNSFLLVTSSISLPLVLKPLYVFLTLLFILLIFSATSILTWITINKMKPVDLLKG